MKVALCPLRMNVVSANAPRPSGAGSAGIHEGAGSASTAAMRTSSFRYRRAAPAATDRRSVVHRVVPAMTAGVTRQRSARADGVQQAEDEQQRHGSAPQQPPQLQLKVELGESALLHAH